MSNYPQMQKKGGGSTSSACSMDSLVSMKSSEGTSRPHNPLRAHEPQREPLKQTENVLRTQNNAVRTENSLNKVRIWRATNSSKAYKISHYKYVSRNFKHPN